MLSYVGLWLSPVNSISILVEVCLRWRTWLFSTWCYDFEDISNVNRSISLRSNFWRTINDFWRYAQTHTDTGVMQTFSPHTPYILESVTLMFKGLRCSLDPSHANIAANACLLALSQFRPHRWCIWAFLQALIHALAHLRILTGLLPREPVVQEFLRVTSVELSLKLLKRAFSYETVSNSPGKPENSVFNHKVSLVSCFALYHARLIDSNL